jgi:hypothetical protein
VTKMDDNDKMDIDNVTSIVMLVWIYNLPAA